MDKAEAVGFYASLTGHILLLVVLTYGIVFAVSPPAPPPAAMEVSFVDEVGLTSAAPEPSSEAPALGAAPELGPIEDAAPAPAPASAERPVPAPVAQQRAAPPQRPAVRQPPARPSQRQGTGNRTARSLLDPNFLDGIGRDPVSRTSRPPAAMTGAARSDIASAIARQVQPCADRQVNPGPGANRIVTEINLSLNPDGSLAARPRAGRQSGLDDENRRYAGRVADLAIASFVGCSPLRGLPRELYDVRGGWRSFTLRYRLPG